MSTRNCGADHLMVCSCSFWAGLSPVCDEEVIVGILESTRNLIGIFNAGYSIITCSMTDVDQVEQIVHS